MTTTRARHNNRDATWKGRETENDSNKKRERERETRSNVWSRRDGLSVTIQANRVRALARVHRPMLMSHADDDVHATIMEIFTIQ